MCSDKYGRASLAERANNIRHLFDVNGDKCSVSAASSERVSHDGRSSIFYCDFVSESHNLSGDEIPIQSV